MKPPANWGARGLQLSFRQCSASISQLWDECWPVWILPSPPSKSAAKLLSPSQIKTSLTGSSQTDFWTARSLINRTLQIVYLEWLNPTLPQSKESFECVGLQSFVLTRRESRSLAVLIQGPNTSPVEQEVKYCVNPGVGALILPQHTECPALEPLDTAGTEFWGAGKGNPLKLLALTWKLDSRRNLDYLNLSRPFWIISGTAEVSFQGVMDLASSSGGKKSFGFLPSFTFVHRVVCAAVSEEKIKTPLINLTPFTSDLMLYKPG